MKKAFIFILSASLIIAALASCGAEPPKEEPTKPLAQSTKSDTPAASTPAPEQKPEPETAPKQATASKEIPEPEPEPVPEPEPEETPEETQPTEPQLFTEVNETVYVVGTNSVNLRSGPGTSYDKVGSLARGESATRTGIGINGTEAEGWSRVQQADGVVYVSSNYLSTTQPAAQQQGGGTQQASDDSGDDWLDAALQQQIENNGKAEQEATKKQQESGEWAESHDQRHLMTPEQLEAAYRQMAKE